MQYYRRNSTIRNNVKKDIILIIKYIIRKIESNPEGKIF